MVICDRYTEMEDYSSYKRRKFHKYRQKLEQLFKGIDDLSLKDKDKLKLREQLKALNINL